MISQPQGKKKKVNKMLCEIVGPENKNKLDLNTGSAARFFDDDDEKKRVTEVIANSFKKGSNKDYNNRVFGYTH